MLNNEFNTQVENATTAISNRFLNEIIGNDSFASQKKYFLTNSINEKSWQIILPLTTDYSVTVFKEIVLTYENQSRTQPDTSTPISLVKLASKILNIKDQEMVVDLCSGNGTFLLNSAVVTPTAHYYGYDIAAPCKDITDIRANLLGAEVETETIDVFELPNRLQLNHSFDKLFSK